MGIVISAYPACGKSYFTEHYSDSYKITDSDSSKFSWITKEIIGEEELNKIDFEYKIVDEDHNAYGDIYTIKYRNPNFIEDYINHIKEAMEEYDIVFVSSHLSVRQALQENNIEFYTVYPNPDISVRNEWLGRMFARGNDIDFIKLQMDMWEHNTTNILNEPHGEYVTRLSNGEYLDLKLIDDIYSYRSKQIWD